MNRTKTFFDSWYLFNLFLRNSEPSKINLLQCYVVLWIHNIDAIGSKTASIQHRPLGLHWAEGPLSPSGQFMSPSGLEIMKCFHDFFGFLFLQFGPVFAVRQRHNVKRQQERAALELQPFDTEDGTHLRIFYGNMGCWGCDVFVPLKI